MDDFSLGWLDRVGKRNGKVLLYRFFSYNENSLGPLIREALFFNSPEAFNDPFDCNLRLITPSEYGVDLEQNQQRLIEKCKKFARSRGIACFTPHWDNTLMWAHYGEKFEGFCLGYEFIYPFYQHIEFVDNKVKPFIVYNGIDYCLTQFSLDEVIYAPKDEFPKTSEFYLEDPEIELEELILRYKAKDWNYEHECRLSFIDGKGIHPVPGKLKEVYFGLRMNTEKKRVLHTILGKYGPTFYNTKESNKMFRIERVEFDPKQS